MSTKTIELIEPHEHAGRNYPVGSELTLDADAADWLIALKVAKPAASHSTRPASAGKPEPTPAESGHPESTKENAA